MRILQKSIRLLNMILIVVAGAGLLGVMGISVANVVLRLTGVRFGGAYELAGFVGAVVIASALGQTQEKKDHVPVDIIPRKFPAGVNTAIDIFKYLLKTAFAIVVAWQMTQYGLRMARSGEVSETLKMPFYPFIFVVAGGFAVLACTVILDVIRSLLPSSPQSELATQQSADQKAPIQEEVPLT
jgi:TRAP-type C4-dicarboxylate transport system permease small subunit